MEGGDVMTASATDEDRSGPDCQARQMKDFRRMVHDARYLLDFALKEWPSVLKRQGRTPIEPDEAIRLEVAKAEASVANGVLPDPVARTAFEDAYFDLSELLAPISVRTIRATSDTYAREVENKRWSVGRRWAVRLWIWTFVFVVIAVAIDVRSRLIIWCPDFLEDFTGAVIWQLAFYMRPFAYGGIGACTYLLRSCVYYIGSREFDPNYQPEYYNRLLLGVVGGGIVYFLLEGAGVLDMSSTAVKKVTPALFGFMAGYFNNRLFQGLERLVEAVLPGVTLAVTQAADRQPTAAPSKTAEKLVDLLPPATDPEDKKIITSLVDKLTSKKG